MYSSAGYDMISDCDFEDNLAGMSPSGVSSNWGEE